METKQIEFTKNLADKKITVKRNFDADVKDVWRAWTESDLLDEWWAPHPWKAETEKMDFRVGGYWLYAMVGPDQSRHWARMDFQEIIPFKGFEIIEYFCDEQGNRNHDLPGMSWKNEFHPTKTGTQVTVEISFSSQSDLAKILDMGFEAGFTSALGNLEHYLSTQFSIYRKLKTSNQARVSTYLNFPGNTEEAFKFYKTVFGTEFIGGIQHFGDVALPAGTPPLSEADKKLIIHVELPILGGHIIMATDAPESMGMKVDYGNNMHINLEPETRAETKRLFDALSAGGKITMELQDLFWGAYYGSCTDQYGINWMFNCTGD